MLALGAKTISAAIQLKQVRFGPIGDQVNISYGLGMPRGWSASLKSLCVRLPSNLQNALTYVSVFDPGFRPMLLKRRRLVWDTYRCVSWANRQPR